MSRTVSKSNPPSESAASAGLHGDRTRRAHRDGNLREKVLATVVQLLEKSLIRVGNDEYAKANNSFGLTTLRDQHVDVKGSTLRFEFRGKSGKRHAVDIDDLRLLYCARSNAQHRTAA